MGVPKGTPILYVCGMKKLSQAVTDFDGFIKFPVVFYPGIGYNKTSLRCAILLSFLNLQIL